MDLDGMEAKKHQAKKHDGWDAEEFSYTGNYFVPEEGREMISWG